MDKLKIRSTKFETNSKHQIQMVLASPSVLNILNFRHWWLFRDSCFVLRVLSLLAFVMIASGASGCSRTFWRRQADLDAYALVREKATHPHWRLPNYTISVDPRSRMYDPYAIDCTPIPPDDPTAHQFMHCVDNKRGWPFWHDNGDRPYVENPAWPEYI